MTAEQEAVIEACKVRFDHVVQAEQMPVVVPDVNVEVKWKGQSHFMTIKPDGTTRAEWWGGVPVRLYGGIPKSDEKKETWGNGLPKHAKPFMGNANDGD